MRYMIIVKADGDAGWPAGMRAFQELRQRLSRAGVLLDAQRLEPPSRGWRLRCNQGQPPRVEAASVDGTAPIAGYALIEVRSPEEALAWAQRCPNPAGDGNGLIELRPVQAD